MFASRHYIRAIIEDRYQFICLLIDFFDTQVEKYEKNVTKQIGLLAKEIAEGDEKIEIEEKYKLLASFANSQDNRNLFYQSMFIMGYSYYESSLSIIEKELKISGLNLTKCLEPLTDIQNKRSWIEGDVKKLRNFITHNNSVAPKNGQDKAIKRLKSIYPEIVYDGSEVFVTKANCVKEILQKEYEVLKDICIEVGFI